ncbi:hypothetical protein B566_EDAN010340 [Ephemera danica]|nr:hypothetical protein B566_EDAN010340 [Ephemera danica]
MELRKIIMTTAETPSSSAAGTGGGDTAVHGPPHQEVGVGSLAMALLTARRLLFLAGFAVAIGVLFAVIPTWLAAWPTLVLTAAYLANWGATLSATFLPKTFVDNIDKRAVLVTGCDSGFGLQLAHRLHKLGATVFAGVLNAKSEGAQQLAKLAAQDETRFTIIPMDVTKDEDVKRAFQIVSENLGDKKLQAVVNNAGVSAVTEVEWCPVETYRQVLEVNALGPIRVTKAFLPLLRSPDTYGRVVIVASLAGRYTFPGFTAYSMSKSAAVSFADGLRREMRKWSISVHTVEPTLYRTPISASEQIQGSMQRHWDRSSDKIKSTYGEEYFQEFKAKIGHQLKRAKPISQISEVVDDMQCRHRCKTSFYVKYSQTHLLRQAITRRNSRRHYSGGEHSTTTTARRTLRRLGSVPSWFLRHNSSGDDKSPTAVFQFPESQVKSEQNGRANPARTDNAAAAADYTKPLQADDDVKPVFEDVSSTTDGKKSE